MESYQVKVTATIIAAGACLMTSVAFYMHGEVSKDERCKGIWTFRLSLHLWCGLEWDQACSSFVFLVFSSRLFAEHQAVNSSWDQSRHDSAVGKFRWPTVSWDRVMCVDWEKRRGLSRQPWGQPILSVREGGTRVSLSGASCQEVFIQEQVS